MLSLARNGYTAAQVDAALKAPVRTLLFRYYLLDSNNNYITTLPNVLEASVSYDVGAAIKRGAKFKVSDNDITYTRQLMQDNPVEWLDTLGTNAQQENLTKTATTSAWDSGAYSATSIPSGDGYVITTVSETNTSRMIGLSHVDPQGDFTKIDFALWVDASGNLSVYEIGTQKKVIGTYATGDVLKVAIENGVVNYYQNGTQVYSSATAPTYPAMAVSTMYTPNATMQNVAIGYVQPFVGINYITDRIQPWVWLQMPDGGYAEFPLGVFLLSSPPRKIDSAYTITREIEGYDQLQILLDDKVIDRYTVTAGTNYITAIQTILTGDGITNTNLTATTLTLPADRDWKPGTTKLQIVNDLLQAINYRSLWFDENGVAQAIPYLTPAQRAPEYTYADDANSIMYPEATHSKDLFALPNEWVLVVSEPDRAPLKAIYTNTNNRSPTSTTNRRRNVVKYIESQEAADQNTLNALAQKMAFQDSQVYEQIEFETAIMPFHSDYDVYTINYTAFGVTDKFSELAWSMDLKVGGRMKHTAQRVVYV